MPKLNFIVFCDEAKLTDNKLDMRGVFDSIYAEGFPAIHKNLDIVVNFDVEKGQSGTEFFVIRKDGGEPILTSQKFIVTGAKAKQQLIHKVQGLNLPKSGKYVVEIYVDDKIIGSNYFMASLIPSAHHA